ncbi:hypothetical protein DBV15_01020 [Temnothorax longispinosus]|uniref:Cullin N-terminal domain-containing protein n=1 Tax=Temnothorax longispinosus TaxID=300112 RepID=A0A4S2JC66_9HYME|nr:hypothetical protein DBV15_01020 [Temnothorax longispinosus]
MRAILVLLHIEAVTRALPEPFSASSPERESEAARDMENGGVVQMLKNQKTKDLLRMTEQEIEEILDKTMVLLGFLQEKDVFERSARKSQEFASEGHSQLSDGHTRG